MRADGRLPEQLRTTRMTPNYLVHAEGSVLVEAGRTRVICTASVEDRVPPFRRNTGKGWVTAGYGMLPRARPTGMQRESTAGRVGGRTQEIQRLIGRSLRAVTKTEELGERTITLDCDVIQADGGTRTAAISGAFVALVLALQRLREQDRSEEHTSELQSQSNIVCRLLLEKKNRQSRCSPHLLAHSSTPTITPDSLRLVARPIDAGRSHLGDVIMPWPVQSARSPT